MTEKYKSTHNERDPETNYDHRQARNSDSDGGRFLSVDPLAGKYPSWSPYNYVMGNPLKWTDPSGEGATETYIKDEEGNVTGVKVSAVVYIYGDGSEDLTKLAGELQNDVNCYWNNASDTQNNLIHSNKFNKDYQVVFDIQIIAVSPEKAKSLALLNGENKSNNFLRVYNGEYNSEFGSGSKVEGNSGVLDLTQNAARGGTSLPHEFGHMLGFESTTNTADPTHFYFDGDPPSPLPMMAIGGGLNDGNLSNRVVTKTDINGINNSKGPLHTLGTNIGKGIQIGSTNTNHVFIANGHIKEFITKP